MQDETYNGWKNYPTWAVNLWLSNDEGMYHAAQEIVDDEIADAPNCLQVRDGIWTVEQAERSNTAAHLREFIEELGVEVDNGQGGTESGQLVGFSSDLFGYALQMVDWDEIADAWITDAARTGTEG